MEIKKLKVAIFTQSYSDTLIAIGLASLMQEFQNDYKEEDGFLEDVAIEKEGSNYIIKMNLPLEKENVERWSPKPGYKFPLFKKVEGVPTYINVFDYELENEKAKTYWEYKKHIKNQKKIKNAIEGQGQEFIEPPKPDSLLNLYRTLNSLRMGSNSVSNLYKYIRDNKLGSFVALKMKKYELDGGEVKLDKDIAKEAKIASLQLFNPFAGKGINKAKPDGVTAGSLNAKFIDWFEEWMKYRAMEKAMLTFSTNNGDTKVFVLSPLNITIDNLEIICKEMRENNMLNSLYKSSLKLDILSVILLAEKLLQKSNYKDGLIDFLGFSPNDIIEGINTAYFKNMGSASAVINISFLGLPGWFPIYSDKDVNDWLEILEEHRECVNSLNEDKSGDIPILIKYREFISSGQIMDFLEFLAMYDVRVMQSMANKEKFLVKPFSTKNLRRVCMGYSLEEITKNNGFQSIATAIRKSTLNLQIRKSKGLKPPFEIKYGLAQDWKRKAKVKEQFIKEIAEFVQQYNNENARNIELVKETRTNIATKDLDELISLVEQYGSELVAMLLLAYGYAKENKEDN